MKSSGLKQAREERHLMESGGVVGYSSQGSHWAARNWSSSQSAAGSTARPQTCQKGRLSRACYDLERPPTQPTFSEGGVTLEALEALDVEDAVPGLHD